MSFRPLPVLSLFTLASLIILILLGNWQYGRYQEKMALGPEEIETVFTQIRIVPVTDNPGMAQQVYGIVGGEAVWRRYVPARIDGKGEIVLALWDATSGVSPVPLRIAVTEPMERRANVFERPASDNMSNKNRPDDGVWYSFDSAAMLKRLGYEPRIARVVEPDAITIRLADDLSRARRTQNPYATPEVRDPLPPERHFGYALTWWGLAAALVGVYLAYHHSKGRLRFKG